MSGDDALKKEWAGVDTSQKLLTDPFILVDSKQLTAAVDKDPPHTTH